MAINREVWARISLEKEGYCSAIHLGMRAHWFLRPDILAENMAKKFVSVYDNGSYKKSHYYKLTPKGLKELKEFGKNFRYDSPEEKLSREEKLVRCNNLINAFQTYSFSGLTIGQYELENDGWMPRRSLNFEPEGFLINNGFMEQHDFFRGEKYMRYYRLTKKGESVLQAKKIKKAFFDFSLQKQKLKANHQSKLQQEHADYLARIKEIINTHSDSLKIEARSHLEDIQSAAKSTSIRSWNYFYEEMNKLTLSQLDNLIKFRKKFKLSRKVK